ncbi:MAG: agmatinase [Phycisphaerae bacterium]
MDQPPTFMDLPPQLRDRQSSRYAVLPVPYEGTVSYKTGTAAGPEAILDASPQLEYFDEQLCGEFYQAGIYTADAVQAQPTPAEQMAAVRAAAGPLLEEGKFLLTLGGEHSITAPLVAATAQALGPISVLQIDAHADLRDSYDGTRHSHAAVMRRVLEITPDICQVGIRNISKEEYEDCRRQIDAVFSPSRIRRQADWIDRAIGRLGPTVYLTIDIDGLDPSIAPGTGTPEPDGLSWVQAIDLLEALFRRRNVVAADIVEVRPIPPNHVTEFLAAKLAYKIIAFHQAFGQVGQ